ncbi:MAG: glycosyltransferase, partial [Merismopedia sp. SIO2A8]|nr:glycosyltransferase [Merismopedia sp. SIO2A8]
NPDVTTIMFGAVSAQEDRKGFAELIQAFLHCQKHPQFRQQIDDGKLKILCVGHTSDLINILGIPALSWGYVDSDETISQLYSASDLFILPSLEDNLPNTMLEAMSCGTPVLAFNVGGIPDFVKPGETGWLVPVRDTVALAKALLTCIFDADERERLGERCRQKIASECSLETQAKKYVELFQDLLE